MSDEIFQFGKEEQEYIKQQIFAVRADRKDCEYLLEAQRVLPVKGYRSAIGSYWNSVVDDLRNKVIYRSLEVFNNEFKAMGGKRNIKEYEDFQNHVTDHDLIECAYKMGAVSWEAKKILHQARETRNVFDGHPKSTSPELVKVLSFISDCNKYVLNIEYPVAIINIEEYIKGMDSSSYDRNAIPIRQAMSDLPETYKKELIHRLFSTYLNPSASTTIKSNIEFMSPILWSELPKEIKKGVGQSFDKEMVKGDADRTKSGLDFLKNLNGLMYVSSVTREAIFRPVIDMLNESLDDWSKEAKAVTQLNGLGYSIPSSCLADYVKGLTKTYVGSIGSSAYYSRKDFYSDAATPLIPPMVSNFDIECVREFVLLIREDSQLKGRIVDKTKLNRLRVIGNIILENGVGDKADRKFIERMCDDTKRSSFYKEINA